MTIYLVCNNVDLGYHVESAWTTEQLAQAEVDRLKFLHKQDGWNYELQIFILPQKVQS